MKIFHQQKYAMSIHCFNFGKLRFMGVKHYKGPEKFSQYDICHNTVFQFVIEFRILTEEFINFL